MFVGKGRAVSIQRLAASFFLCKTFDGHQLEVRRLLLGMQLLNTSQLIAHDYEYRIL
jgi:hypothetical protein